MASSETHYTLPAPSFTIPPRILIVRAPYYNRGARRTRNRPRDRDGAGL